MLLLLHESFNFDWAGHDQGGAISTGEAYPRGEGWHKDRCSLAGSGGMATRAGDHSTWAESYDLGTFDSCRERGGSPDPDTETTCGTPDSDDTCCAATVSTTSRKEPARVWLAPGCLGRADSGDSPETMLWCEAEGSASPEVDAPIGL